MARRVPGKHRLPARPSRAHRVGAVLCAAVAAGAVGLSLVPAASGSTSTTTASAGRFLSGSLSLAGTPLDTVAALAGVSAASRTGEAAQTSASPLSLSALGAQLVELPGGVSLPLSSFLTLGAVNQYASANPDGTTRAAAGAVDNTGAVDTSPASTFPSDAGIDLVGLLGAPATGVLSSGSLTLGGLTGVAATTAGSGAPATSCADLSAPQNCRGYTIARGGLTLASPLVATLTSAVGDALDTISGTVDSAVKTDVANALLSGVTGLLGTLDTLVPGLSIVSNTLAVSLTTDLRTAVSALLNQTLDDGVVTLDLATGTITVDLDALTGGLNNLPPNTHVLTAAQLDELVSRIGALLAGLQSELISSVTAALDAVTVTVSGGICLLSLVTCTAGLDISYSGTLGDLAAGTAALSVAGTGLLTPTGAVLTTVLTTLQSLLATAVSGDLTTAVTSTTSSALAAVSTLTAALDPVLQLLHAVLDLVVNVQEPGAATGSYREVALRAALGAGSLATLDLARAEVAAQSLTAPTSPAPTTTPPTTTAPSTGATTSTPTSSVPTSTASPPSSTVPATVPPATTPPAPHTPAGSTPARVPRIDTGLGAAASAAGPRRLPVWTLGGAGLLLVAAAMLLLVGEGSPRARRTRRGRS